MNKNLKKTVFITGHSGFKGMVINLVNLSGCKSSRLFINATITKFV